MSETVKVGDVTMVKLKHLGWCSVDAHGEPLPSRDELCDALATAQRERAEWEANAQRENAALVQAQQRIAALEAEAQDVQRERDALMAYARPCDIDAALGRMLKEGE